MNVLDKQKLLEFMCMRKAALDEQIYRDFTGGIQSRIFEQREVKYWKEAIERGEFDVEFNDKSTEVYIILSADMPEIADFTFYIDEESVKRRVDELNGVTKNSKYWYITLYSNHKNSGKIGEYV